MRTIIPVILCGGSGTRLWPVSRRDRPKQLATLVGEESLLYATLRRASAIAGARETLCVTGSAYAPEIRRTLDDLALGGRLLIEPEPRNTAPAIAAAAVIAAEMHSDAILVTLPADQFIEEGEAFPVAVGRACAAAAKGWITVLGVNPRNPSAAFGYIVPGEAVEGLPGVSRVRQFIEKPIVGVAEQLIAGRALWNAGLVVAEASRVVSALQQYQPALLEAVKQSLAVGESNALGLLLERTAFSEAPSISFDHAVLERSGSVAVTQLDAGWRDLGTWGEVAELYPADGEGNRRRGRVLLSSSRNSFIFSPHRFTVGVGLTDIIVVDTPDALLVATRADLWRLREVVEEMGSAAYAEAGSGLQGDPPDRDKGATSLGASEQISRIVLTPGETVHLEPNGDAVSYWIVIEGLVQVTIDGRASTFEADHSFRVPPGVFHSIANLGQEKASLVQILLVAKSSR